MSKEAVIQGEMHTYEKDKIALLNHGLENFDALLIEGRSTDIPLDKFSYSYLFFILGYIMWNFILFCLERFKFRINQILSQVKISDEEQINLYEKVEKVGIPYYEDIDADIEEMYSLSSNKERRVMWIVPLAFILTIPIANQISSLIISGILPLTYFWSLIIWLNSRGKRRDKHMAKEIDEKAEEEDLERVIVSCGQSHVDGISEKLEELGWKTEPNYSKHWIYKIYNF